MCTHAGYMSIYNGYILLYIDENVKSPWATAIGSCESLSLNTGDCTHQPLKCKVPADDSGSWTKILYCLHYDTNLKIQDPKMVLLGRNHYT